MTDCIRSAKVLKGKAMIAKAIGSSDYVIDNLMPLGFPAFTVRGTLYSHLDAIEDFFKAVCTKYRGKELGRLPADQNFSGGENTQ